MTTRARYFIIVSLLVLAVGIGAGLVAYHVHLSEGASAGDIPDELRDVPRDAVVVAYADVKAIMASGLREKIRRAASQGGNGPRQFQEQTGIDLESDIDRVIACLQTRPGGNAAGLLLASGRFNSAKIEALMLQHGAEVESYRGGRVLAFRNVPRTGGDALVLSFLAPGLMAVGSRPIVRAAIDLQTSGGDNVTKNRELMGRLSSLDRANLWAMGQLDALRSDTRLPESIVSRLPAITWFSIAGHVDKDGEIRGVLRADARDDESAVNLRELVRSVLAFARVQARSRPAFQTMLQSLALGGTGRNVTLSFSIPGAVFDLVGGNPTEPRPSAH